MQLCSYFTAIGCVTVMQDKINSFKKKNSRDMSQKKKRKKKEEENVTFILRLMIDHLCLHLQKAGEASL